jgi:hypothetical protein
MKNFKPIIHSIEINEYINVEIDVTPYEFRWAQSLVEELGYDFEEHNLIEITATPEHLMSWLILNRRKVKKGLAFE